jgi:outer membrane protein
MRKSIKLALLTLLLGASTAFAQKYAHINSNELLLAMPERKQAETTLQEYAKQLDNQIKTMSGEYDAKVADYQKNEPIMTDVIKQDKIKEINDLEERIKTFQGTAQESLQKKEQELMQPMINKAKKAIEDVAKENNYKYVFDSSVGVLLFADPSDDILPLVKKKMNLPDTPAPKAATPPAPKK